MTAEARLEAERLNAHAMKIVTEDPQTAMRCLISASAMDPTYFDSWFNMALIQGEVGALGASVFLYKKALEINPNHLQAWINLSFRAHWNCELALAEQAARRALELDPLDHFAHINLSVTLSVQERLTESFEEAQRALACKNNHESQLAMAFAAMYSGDFALGLSYHESRYENQLKNFLNLPWPKLTRDDNISGKHVVVISEQGLGDTLSFTRFVPELAKRAKRVELLVHPELLRLMTSSMIVYPNVFVRTTNDVFPAADYWTSFMSLPAALGLANEVIIDQEDIYWPPFQCGQDFRVSPNVVVDGIPIFSDNYRKKLHVGLVWSGNPQCSIERFRRVDLPLLRPFAEVPGVQLYSLQVGAAQPEIHSTGFSTFIRDLSPMIKDVADTFGILKLLDLVITTDTAVGHMCGALGIPCWIMYSYMGGDFRIGRTGDEHLWYPKHQIFKQRGDMKWDSVIKRIELELHQEVARKCATATSSTLSRQSSEKLSEKQSLTTHQKSLLGSTIIKASAPRLSLSKDSKDSTEKGITESDK